MSPPFLKQVFLFLQTTNLKAYTASQLDINGQGMAWRNPFSLYAAPQVNPIRAVRRTCSASLHFTNLLPMQTLLPSRRGSSAYLVSLTPALQMKLSAQTHLRAEPKLPVGLFALSTCFCWPILCQANGRCGWPRNKTDCCQDPEGLFLISADRFGSVWEVYFSVFSLLLIVRDKGSTVSFPREQKHEVCSLRILQGKMLADS